jgi:hypothetical protein
MSSAHIVAAVEALRKKEKEGPKRMKPVHF